ncbi:hypothetical protein CR513_28012, partial [Mucuna pruriens]
MVVKVFTIAKKPHGRPLGNKNLIQRSSVFKCLFNHPSFHVPTNSLILKIPSKTHSSHIDTLSLIELPLVATCNGEDTPSYDTTITTTRVMIDPTKQMAHIKSSPCISLIEANVDKANKNDKNDCVGSKLDVDIFDMLEILEKLFSKEISTFESFKEVDLSDIT